MNKGLFQTLFDFSFSEFVTTRLIKVLFIIGIAVAAIASLVLLGKAFSDSFLSGLFMLVLSPVIFLVYVLFARVWCEMIIVVFRIAENTSRLANKTPDQPQ